MISEWQNLGHKRPGRYQFIAWFGSRLPHRCSGCCCALLKRLVCIDQAYFNIMRDPHSTWEAHSGGFSQYATEICGFYQGQFNPKFIDICAPCAPFECRRLRAHIWCQGAAGSMNPTRWSHAKWPNVASCSHSVLTDDGRQQQLPSMRTRRTWMVVNVSVNDHQWHLEPRHVMQALPI